MANRIRGSVIIIDSGTINLSFIQGKITGAAFYGTDTSSRLIITLASDTTDSVFAFAPPGNTPIPWSANQGFADPIWFTDTLRVLNLVNGTGYLYTV